MYIHRIFPLAPIITSIKKINHIFQTRKITSLLWDRTGKLLHWRLLPSILVILSARSKRESNLTVKCKDTYAEELPILVQVAHDHTTYLQKLFNESSKFRLCLFFQTQCFIKKEIKPRKRFLGTEDFCVVLTVKPRYLKYIKIWILKSQYHKSVSAISYSNS